MDDKWLKRTVRKWQRKLRLMDWTITSSFAPSSTLEEGSVANVQWEPGDTTNAQMWVLLPSEVKHAHPAWYIESCIVHELGHLKFYGHAEPRYDVNEERALNDIALALFPERKAK